MSQRADGNETQSHGPSRRGNGLSRLRRAGPLRFVVMLIVLAVVTVAAVLGYRGLFRPEQKWKITLATGTEGGTYHELGVQGKAIFENLPGNPISMKVDYSEGSVENIERLLSGKADLGFVMAPALVEADDDKRRELRVVARLYTDVLQIIICPKRDPKSGDMGEDSNLESIDDLASVVNSGRVFVGAPGSATRIVAKEFLYYEGLWDDKLGKNQIWEYADAANKLGSDIDAAFFVSGIPANCVTEALEKKNPDDETPVCHFLPFGRNPELLRAIRRTPGHKWNGVLKELTIPADVYDGQEEEIDTLGTDVYLVCRKDLDDELVITILEAMFDNSVEWLSGHSRAQDIRLTNAFSDWPSDASTFGQTPFPSGHIDLHNGAKEFRARESKKLVVASGPIGGKYYDMGRRIATLLRQEGIPTRLLHTDGSLENARLLSERPLLALMQFDVALATRPQMASAVYGKKLQHLEEIIPVPNIQRIATLHHEKLYVVARKEDPSEASSDEPDPNSDTTIVESSAESLSEHIQTLLSKDKKRTLTVCVGPMNGGTRMLAEAILGNEKKERIRVTHLPAREMVDRLLEGRIDIGFFVSYVPSDLFRTVLNDTNIRLLSIDPETQSELVGVAFNADVIEAGTHPCQEKDSPPVQTLSTRAVLVTTEDLPFDVERITSAIINGRGYLGLTEEEQKDMAGDLASFDLHQASRKSYQTANLLPKETGIDWLTVIWESLAIIVMLLATYRGFVKFKRDHIANEIGRRVLAVEVKASTPDSANRLMEIREEIKGRVRRRWWRLGELDKSRWRYLDGLIADRIKAAKESMTLAILSEVRAVESNNALDQTARLERFEAFEDRVRQCCSKGELDASHRTMLTEVLQEGRQRASSQKKGVTGTTDAVAGRIRVLRQEVEQQNDYLAARPRAKVDVAVRKVTAKAEKLDLTGVVEVFASDRKLDLKT